MSEPSPVEPFTTQPRPAAPFAPERARTPSGCGRYALVGCGALTLLLGIAAVVFLFKASDLLAWTLGQIESQLSAKMPEDMTAEERSRLAAAFAGARGAVRSGKLDPKSLQILQAKLQKLGMEGARRPTREEILSLAEVLERVAAVQEPARATAAPTSTP